MTAPKPPLAPKRYKCQHCGEDKIMGSMGSYHVKTGSGACGEIQPQPLSGAAPAPQKFKMGDYSEKTRRYKCGCYYRDVNPEERIVHHCPHHKEKLRLAEEFGVPCLCDDKTGESSGCPIHDCPAAPVAVPAQDFEIAKEYGFTEQETKDIVAAEKAAPLPPPQEPACDGPCKDCGLQCLPWSAPNATWNRIVPERSGLLCPRCFIQRAFKMGINIYWEMRPDPLMFDEDGAVAQRTEQGFSKSQVEGSTPSSPTSPAALAGETRTEARKHYLNPQQRAKWERRLEAGMDKSEDFPECTPDQRAVLWTLLELKQSERALAAAESRIAQLEREKKSLQIQLDAAAETLREHTSRLLTAEAALTQAQQERDAVLKYFNISFEEGLYEVPAEPGPVTAESLLGAIQALIRLTESDSKKAEVTKLMEAIGPYMEEHCELTTNANWQRAKRVYEQVKQEEKI